MTSFAPANAMSTQPSGHSPLAGSSSESRGSAAGPVVLTADLHQTRDRIVIFMMTLVATAAGAMVHMHLGYTVSAAVVAGGALWASFIALHTLKKRAAQIGRLRSDVSRLEQEVGHLRTKSPAATKVGSATAAAVAPVEFKVAPGAAKAKSAAGMSLSPQSLSPQDTNRAPNLTTDIHPSPRPFTGGPTSAVGAPERISPDARWEAPNLGRPDCNRPDLERPDLERFGKFTKAAKTDTIAQNPITQSPVAQSRAPAPGILKPDHSTTAEMPAASHRAGARPSTSNLFEAPSWSGTSIASADPLRDAWSFRPKEASAARPFAPDSGAPEENALRIPAAPPAAFNGAQPPRGLEADLEMVQRKIKAMAEEVNAAEAIRLRPLAEPKPVMEPDRAAPTTAEAFQSAGQGAGYATPAAANYGTAAMAIEEGISALKSAAGTMRAPAASTVMPGGANLAGPNLAEHGSTLLPPADLLIPATAQTIAVSAPPISAPPGASASPLHSDRAPSASMRSETAMRSETVPQRSPEARTTEAQQTSAPTSAGTHVAVDGGVAEIAKAIEAKNMDVLLSPIVGLGDYAVSHFEVVVRLLGSDGAVIDSSGEAVTLAGHHLLALFDAERLSRTAAVAELLESRGKNGAVLTAATGASMSDASFLETFARVYETRNAISGQLVLTFSQADVEAFGTGTWQALSDMHAFGFRFALDHVTHLGMDFEHLAQCGFTFVKLPAQVFLKGLPSDAGFITVNDICRHIARCGLTLVVGAVDDEALLARVFGFGALFGQGQLFGAPRQISLDNLAPARSAAA